MTFITKVTDKNDITVTGAKRGSQAGKPRFDLIGDHAQLREAELLGRGAEHYGERNWEKGQNVSRTLASLMRHVMAYKSGDRTEDHLAAIRFNAGSIMHVEEEVKLGRLPEELLDISFYADLPEFHQVPQLTEREALVADWMNAMQDESYYVETFNYYNIKTHTLPSLAEGAFNEVLASLMLKGVLVGTVVENQLHADYTLTRALNNPDYAPAHHSEEAGDFYMEEPDEEVYDDSDSWANTYDSSSDGGCCTSDWTETN